MAAPGKASLGGYEIEETMSFYSEFAEYYEMVFPFREEVYSFLREGIGKDGGRLLDLGCGSGHYSGHFTRYGFSSVGVDLDQSMIEVAREKYPDTEFYAMNMLEVGSLESPFNAAFCIGNVLSHLTKDEVRELINSLKDVLCPGGEWIFQIVNWDFVLGSDSYEFPIREVGGLRFHRCYRDISASRVTFETRLSSEGKTIFLDQISLYPLSSNDYRQILTKAGFEVLGHYADYRRSAFNSETNSASIFVTRSPRSGVSVA